MMIKIKFMIRVFNILVLIIHIPQTDLCHLPSNYALMQVHSIKSPFTNNSFLKSTFATRKTMSQARQNH